MNAYITLDLVDALRDIDDQVYFLAYCVAKVRADAADARGDFRTRDHFRKGIVSLVETAAQRATPVIASQMNVIARRVAHDWGIETTAVRRVGGRL